jgi:hypothetical protein
MSEGEPDDAKTGERKSRRARARLSEDLARAEAMVAAAAADGITLESGDIAAIKAARGMVDRGAWISEWESRFYAAIGRIGKTVHYPSVQVFNDLKASDELLSHASLGGLPIAKQDIEALTRARIARVEGVWTARIESDYYAALNRISNDVLPVVAATAGRQACRGARRAIRIYTITTISLTILVVALSCLLFSVNQISDDVAKMVAINDPAAMMLHNQSMSHQSSIIETRQGQEREIRKLVGSAFQQHNRSQGDEESVISARQKGSSDLRSLSNSQPALQIKDLLQRFATNNRQLYNDVTRTRGIGKWLHLPVINPYTEANARSLRRRLQPAHLPQAARKAHLRQPLQTGHVLTTRCARTSKSKCPSWTRTGLPMRTTKHSVPKTPCTKASRRSRPTKTSARWPCTGATSCSRSSARSRALCCLCFTPGWARARPFCARSRARLKRARFMVLSQ